MKDYTTISHALDERTEAYYCESRGGLCVLI
jgi:hypothetical protein